MPESTEKFNAEFIKAAIRIARRDEIRWLCWVMDGPVPPEILKARGFRKKLVVATTVELLKGEYSVQGIPAIQVPAFPYSRLEKIQVAIGAGISTTIFKSGETVLCLTGRYRSDRVDTLFRVRIGEDIDQRVSFEFLKSASGIPAQFTETLLKLAIQVGAHGKEGYPVGTIIVIGDTVAVLEKSRQIVLNPFQGYSEAEKNIMDPEVREAIKSYATLDGAFVIREDGVVLSAGRYLNAGVKDIKLPLGLGARHAAAAAITRETKAVAIVVSQTSGAVRIFEGGEIIFELQSRSRVGE
jgi:DNA integrity scanning protein DisA with diadenylate cyclase activity